MKEIKFRIWDREDTIMRYFTLDKMLERRLGYYGSFDLKVLRETKMQYTGLKDKNDEEIYEGDIVEMNGSYLQVYYFNGHWFAGNDFLSDVLENECSIIGNIYDNPELVM